MSDAVVVFGFPLLVVALAFGYAAFTRYLRHKERVAMIERGLVPSGHDGDDDDDYAGLVRRDGTWPIVITVVGIAITLGLLTLGRGPWLIGGLVPTAYGVALIIRDMILERKRRDEGE